MKTTRQAVSRFRASTIVVAIAFVAAFVLLAVHAAHGQEPSTRHDAPAAASSIPPGSIPAIGYRPEVVGYYRPVLLRAPSLFPNVFIRYRRGFVFEPLRPSPAMPTPPPVQHFRFE